ncbi:MAG TPA: glycosyltransferase family 4 protein [Candidatus Polarisedimenticolia bacterium]|jgi:glycosyltransferase involved in cell wall biosynthesis
MRVIHFTGAEVIGGLLHHVRLLAREQVAAGHAVKVIFSTAAAVDREAEACAGTGAGVERMAVKGKTDLPGMAALGRLVERERPEILHFHLSSPIEAIPAIMAAKVAGARHIVTTEHAPTWFPLEKPYSRAAKMAAGRFVDRVIAVCRSDARFLQERFGVPEKRIAVILNGVAAPDAIEPRDAARARLGLPLDASPLVGFLGALEEKKGVLDLLEGAALAGLPALALAMAGEGPLGGALRERAGKLGLRLILPGRIEKVEPFLASLDVFALPSHQEAMPLSLLQAMWTGLPVVASRVGGIPEAIEEGVSGLLIEAGRPDQIAGALGRLHASPALAARLGEGARAAASAGFSSARMAREVEALYREVVLGSAGQGAAPGPA